MLYKEISELVIAKNECADQPAQKGWFAPLLFAGNTDRVSRVDAYNVEAQTHTGKCIRRFAGIYAYCRYFIDRKW